MEILAIAEKVRGNASKREYLTIDELKALIATDCSNNKLVEQPTYFPAIAG